MKKRLHEEMIKLLFSSMKCYKELPDVNKGKGRGGNVCLPLKGCGSCKASQNVSSGHLGSLLFYIRLCVAGLVLFDWL